MKCYFEGGGLPGFYRFSAFFVPRKKGDCVLGYPKMRRIPVIF